MFGKYILTYYMCNIYNVFGYKKYIFIQASQNEIEGS